MEQDILGYFVEETSQLLQELSATVEAIEDSEEFPENGLREFAQKIDRVMGAAKSLGGQSAGVVFIARVSEACKTMGYQAAALKRSNLIPIFAAFWAETIEILSEVVEQLADAEACAATVEKHSSRLQNRLAWLAERVAPTNEEERNKVTALLKNL